MKDTEEGGEMGSIYISSEQIIQEVQKFRCLYDPSHPDHKDRDVMRDAWLSVTQAVVGEPWANLNSAEKNEAADEAEKRWRKIRDCWRNSLNNSGKTRKAGVLTNELTFASEEDQSKSDSDYSAETSATHETDEQSETTDSGSAPESPSPRRKKLRPRKVTTQKDNSCESEQSSDIVPYNLCIQELKSSSNVNYQCVQSTSMPEPENPDRMFLLSLLPRVSVLSSRSKLDFQIKAMQMLRGFEKHDSKS